MRVERNENVFLLRMEPGEEVVHTLETFAARNSIEAAEVRAIGAVTDFELGYYIIPEKKYIRKKFDVYAELISCLGNLAIREGKNFVHLHVTAGLQDYSVVGGHLFSGIVSATVEAFVAPFPGPVERIYDERTGLYLLDLPRETF
jgi:predicted DNA-binding protein with PD1-like motif